MNAASLTTALFGPLLNLAPLKYANCFQADGGPIQTLEESCFEIKGEQYAVVNATLAPGLTRKDGRNNLYSSADGSGVHRNPVTARHIAISEALERWAHSQTWNSAHAADFGFDQDPSSNGMAAFPGFFPQQARAYALNEAVERFTLLAWWEGMTDAHPVSVTGWMGEAYRIRQPFPGFEVVLLRRFDEETRYPCYGYGSGKNLFQAAQRAEMELERSRFVLGRFFQRNPGFEMGDLSILKDYLEKRLVYFSLPEGARAFEERMARPSGSGKLTCPPIAFDGEIPGPWSQWATVWRVAFRMPTRAHLAPQSLFFYW
jgi:hypothetical protein